MGAPAEDELVSWGHHRDVGTVPDAVMQRMDPGIVSFVFSCKARRPDFELPSAGCGASTLPQPLPDACLHGMEEVGEGKFPKCGRR
jgi:hypothetical protein